MPTIMFVIDGSGSMCAPFENSTRWQAVRTARLDPMRGLVYRLQGSVTFGATLYDDTIDFALALTGLCGRAGQHEHRRPTVRERIRFIEHGAASAEQVVEPTAHRASPLQLRMLLVAGSVATILGATVWLQLRRTEPVPPAQKSQIESAPIAARTV
jgi:hypothetical protein